MKTKTHKTQLSILDYMSPENAARYMAGMRALNDTKFVDKMFNRLSVKDRLTILKMKRTA